MQAILSLPIVDIAMIIGYLWIWAGFAMVVIGAGLAALNREVLEAAQIDGASEWQTLRRVTVPMLMPVLVVVFVTMLINVLKIFDIILNMAAPSSQSGAATIAVDIYNDFETTDGPGTRRRACRGAVHPGRSGDAVQPQEDPRMSVQAASLPVAAQAKRQRFRLRPSRIVLNVALAAIAIFWLVPSIGIAIISLRPNSAFEQSGWWTVLTAPAQLTFSNYQGLLSAGFKAGGVLDSLTTSIAITVPVTILVTLISSLTAYSLVFGRWRGRTVVFLLIVAMLVLPLQMALIPVASLYKVVRHRHRAALVRFGDRHDHLPRGLRLAVRYLPDAQLLLGHPA